MHLALIALGILFLYLGGEAMVRGASSLARTLGLRPMVIGLTVVSFATSSPELASSLAAALRGVPEIAFANVVGSNIANVGLILALTALIWPLASRPGYLRFEFPFMIASSALVFWLVRDGWIGRFEGLGLLALLGLFLAYLLRAAQAPEADEEGAAGPRRRSIPVDLLLIGAGIALLVLGARSLVSGAIELARIWGVSERVIGLTMVAVGTSLPELASSLVAAVRREGDILVGNIIGSNVFNILCILGATALVKPLAVAASEVWIDLLVMLGLSLVIWPLLVTRLRLDRWKALLLLAAYGAYLAWLF